MDFFANQDRARSKTKLLVFYYIIAIALIIGSIYALVMGMIIHGMGDSAQKFFSYDSFGEKQVLDIASIWWQPRIFLACAGATLLVVLTGSFYKIASLARGGKVVALSLGGRLLKDDEGDLQIKKLLNVVEEMAIASGMPVPAVYLLEHEQGINAFAAGFSQHDAVVGVTRGCIEQLNRDELQGVIAHEFSHILNGDMRLNIRLMGIVHGILLIALAGYWLLRSGSYSHRRGTTFSLGSSRKNNREGGGIALFGLGLMVIGYIGVFFGNLIKSAVSREREYLADSSAVQFTRNPIGIANALKKIGGFPTGSKIFSPKAEEASHMFFSDGIKHFFSFGHLLATHPPLPDRITRLDPSFKGDYQQLSKVKKAHISEAELHEGVSSFSMAGAKVVNQVAEVTSEHLNYAQTLLASLPAEIKNKTRETYGARAIVYSLLIDSDDGIEEKQLNDLASNAEQTVFQETLRIYKNVKSLPRKFYFPLLELCLPALTYLSKSEYHVFKENLEDLILADRKTNLFEYGVKKLISKHLDIALNIKSAVSNEKEHSLEDLQNEIAVVLSSLSYIGQPTALAKEVFYTAVEILQLDLDLVSKGDCSITNFDSALEKLISLRPQAKKKFIEACVTCVNHDGQVTIKEAELLRLIADILDCPIPPFLD